MTAPYLNFITNPAYYNDFDEDSAAWLRELIKRGLIAPGEVDGRSILDVSADDLSGFTQCHFFAGIGGWSYALRLAGWPDDQPVWTGSPPCQPFSAAGRQEGRNDARHLAPHFVDLVRAARPGMLFGEQVASAKVFGKPAKPSRRNTCPPPQWAWIDDLSDRLEAARYTVGANDFPSAGVGAPHIRQRTYFGAVAHECQADPDDARLEGRRKSEHRCSAERTAGARGVADGLADTCSQRRTGRNVCLRSNEERSALDFSETERGGCSMLPTGRPADDSYVGSIHSSTPSRPTDGFWGNADWLFCRDGKWRPVESSIFGMVDGLPGCVVPSGPLVPASFPLAQGGKEVRRVSRLRGYGNAINPWAAKEFIQAFVEALNTSDCGPAEPAASRGLEEGLLV